MSAQTYYLLLDKYIEKEEIHKIAIGCDFKKEEGPYNHYGRQDLYSWEGPKYESIRGCYFSYGYDVDLSDHAKETDFYKTLCATSTRLGCSYADRNKQIEIIKTIQDLYGGKVYDPNRNAWGLRENIIPQLSKTEIACGMVYVNFKVELYKARYSIEKVDTRQIFLDVSLDRYELPRSLHSNNRLLTQFVSIFETFLKEFFVKYLETNDKAYENFTSFPKKELRNEVKKSCSFQNLNPNYNKSAIKVYKKFLNFDLKKEVLDINYKNETITILLLLKEILDIRHKIVHETEYNKHLTKEKMMEYSMLIEKFGEVFIHKFQEKHNLKLLIENEIGY